MEINAEKMVWTGATDVPMENFVQICERLALLSDVEHVEFRTDADDMPGTTAVIMYRDEYNYKYPFALYLTPDASVEVQEPEWKQDEDEDKEVFWHVLREELRVPHPFY